MDVALPLNQAQIRALIPHHGSMCLLSEVLRADANKIVCHSTSQHDADNPLRANSEVSIWSGIEYAAQAMAVHGRLQAECQIADSSVNPSAHQAKPKRGYIVVLSQVEAFAQNLSDIESLIVCCEQEMALATGSSYRFALYDGARKHYSDVSQLSCVLSGSAVVSLDEDE